MKVRLSNLTKIFSDDVVAVDNINLEIPTGQFTVLLGPSGCGKTTTLRMIAGLESPDSGNIFIGDRLVNRLPPKDRNVAMVFQSFALYPSMNVFDNIAFPLRVRGSPKPEIEERVEEVAHLVGIQHLLGRSPSQVSGGEAQRVALARTMVREPDVLLMDEPLSQLDSKLRLQLRAELKRLHQQVPCTTIYVTHDQEEAMTLGDRIIVMNHGQVQQMGTGREIFFQPHNRFVAEFVGSPGMNLLEGQARRQGDVIVFESAGFSQPLPVKPGIDLLGNDVRPVIWGIRPDKVRILRHADTPEVQARADVVELLGTRQLVYLNVRGVPFTALTDSDLPLAPGDLVHLRFEPGDVYLFDASSGQSLLMRPTRQDEIEKQSAESG